jgi:hypothetical protein
VATVSLRDGPDLVTLYPDSETTDGDGNPVRQPDRTQATTVRGRMSPAGSSEDNTDGQATATTYRLVCRDFPAGAWALAEWGEREWDVVGEPTRRSASPATARTVVTLRARTPEVI